MRKRRKGRLLLVGMIAVAVATTTALLVTAGPATARGTASLAVLEGAVTVEDATGVHDGRTGETLEEGDIVRTAVDGRAEIRYFDGSVTRLDRETEFTITELDVLEESNGKQVEGTQNGGRTFSRVVKLTGSESRFDVATPTATASVQGTIFDTRHLPDGSSVVWVLEGAVAVSGDDDRLVTVRAYEGVLVDGDGTTNAPFPLRPWQLRDPWLQFNLCEVDAHATCYRQPAPTVPPPPAAPAGDRVLGAVFTQDAEVTDDGGARSTGGSGGGTDSDDKPKQDKPKDPPKNDGGGGGGGGEEPEPPKEEPTVVDIVCGIVEPVTGELEPPCN